MKILVVGITGMLGNTFFRYFSDREGVECYGTARSARAPALFSETLRSRIQTGVDAEDFDSIVRAFGDVRPDVVLNAVGLIKQLKSAQDPLAALPVNSLFPHRLARLCAVAGARLVHVSTDCVFSGSKGLYRESDPPDALDLYGRSKLIGEVDYPHCITLRTSIIGHELASANALLGWFLAQSGEIKGYSRAVFSGLPTVELARVIDRHVLPRPDLHGLYHVASEPINKLQLLRLFAREYSNEVDIVADDTLVIDRSLDASRFNAATGYAPPPWPELVAQMKNFG